MGFEDLDFEEEPEGLEGGALPEETSNRTFLIIVGVIGLVAIMALVCIGIVWYSVSQGREAEALQDATLTAQVEQVEAIIAQTATKATMEAIIAAYTHTPTKTLIPSSTFTPTATTPVVAESPTSTLILGTPGTVTMNPLLATATEMQAILNTRTLTVRPSATAIGSYGFADEVGLPAMLGLAGLLIVVIFLARRLRTAS
ncbi:MAG: hypothetical protein JXA78_05910 [Anaerolineales bacterium]|nr:hypothetical protein [Anaerolineales bacterium]